MKKILTTIAIIIFGTGTVAGAIFYRQGVDKDTEIKAHRIQIATLNDQLSGLDKNRETLQKQIAETIEQLNALKNNNQYIIRLESLIQKKEAAVASARQLTNQCNGAKETLLAQIEDGKKSTQSLNELLADFQGQVQTLKRQIEKNRKVDASLIADLNARHKSVQDTAHHMGEKLIQANDHVLTEQKKVLALSDDLLAAEQKKSSLETLIQNKETAIDAYKEKTKEEISALQAQIQREVLAYAYLKKQVAGIESDKGSIENRLNEMKSTYDGLVKELSDNIRNKEATIEECKEKLTISFIDQVLFRSAMISITPEGKEMLKKTGDILKKLKSGKFRIVGHTDDKPIRSRLQKRFPSNWELSSARAAAVARFFETENGISPNRMEVVGYSHQEPIAGNQTEAGRSKNRRVEIIVVPDLWSHATPVDS
jgi:chemotaxis protein MotB